MIIRSVKKKNSINQRRFCRVVLCLRTHQNAAEKCATSENSNKIKKDEKTEKSVSNFRMIKFYTLDNIDLDNFKKSKK